MKDSQKQDKEERRMQILNVVIAANYYDLACMWSSIAQQSTTIAGAQEVAKIIKSFNGKKLSEFYRIRLTDDYADNAIKCFEIYRDAAQIYPFDKSDLQSFCKWYSLDENKFNVWTQCADYIIGIGLASLGFHLGKITNIQMDDRIGTVTSSESCVFSYSPRLVLRSFAEISAKFKEIEAKLTNRNSKKRFTITH